jgi:tetratricopeptide (TPR) repeat protein
MPRPKFSTALALVVFAALMSSAAPNARASSQDEVCDVTADYFLGVEDYPQAIESHLRVITRRPDDALAHYHLGFAYGMLGSHRDELSEYRRAVGLGLRKWDLFLNLGRLYLENGHLQAASDALTTATTLGPAHAEAHFNLALAYERRGAFGPALFEIQTSLGLDANQPDARNMLGLLYAEQGNFAEARRIWSDLAAAEPNFAPARANLALPERIGQPPHREISDGAHRLFAAPRSAIPAQPFPPLAAKRLEISP